MRASALFRAAALVLVAALLGLVVPTAGSAQTLRKSIAQFTPTELMSLRRGVGVMMARNTAPRNSADFRRSWVYWANMHAHFGADCRGAITGAGMTGIQLWTASNPNEEATWCSCEHGTDQFTTWHRMFLFYFERVLQQAAGDPRLRLPFWDYATSSKLPFQFRSATYVNEQGATVPNPLRVEERRAQLNSGAVGLQATVTSSSNAMAATSFGAFRTRLEATPHGAVHCAIGLNGCPTGRMGSIPAAALDPIFYLHHANIDRLYECWLDVDPAARMPSNPAILNRTYSFVDENGAVVTRRVGDMLTTEALGYDYPRGGGCPAPAAASATLAQASSTELQRGLTTAPLAVERAGGTGAAARSLEAAPAGATGAATVHIEGVAATQVPGVLYNVFLANKAGEREQIGVIDFFGFGDSGGAHAGHGGGADGGRRFEFDATAAVAALGLDPDARPNLVFEPTTGLTDSTVEAATTQIPRNARVRYRRAWLEMN